MLKKNVCFIVSCGVITGGIDRGLLKGLGFVEYKFGFSTPDDMCYQLERSGGQEYHDSIMKLSLYTVSGLNK